MNTLRPHLLKIVLMITVLITLFSAGTARAGGSYDCPFATFGAFQTNYPGGSITVKAMAIYASGPQLGKIVVAGEVGNDFGVFRLNADGRLDTTFSDDGYAPATNVLSDWDSVHGVAALADGSVAVSGKGGGPGLGNHLAVVRFTAAGQLDPAFSGDGILVQRISSGDYYETWQGGMAADAAGNLYVAGQSADAGGNVASTVVKVSNTGSVAGVWTAHFAAAATWETFNAITLQSDGKVVAGGDAISGSARIATVARFNTSGALDAAFSGDGMMTFAYRPLYETITALGMQGTSIIAGFNSAPVDATYDFGVARITPAGAIDTSFAAPNGMTAVHVNTQDFLNTLVVQADGKIVVAGAAHGVNVNRDFTLLRFTAAGALDASFGSSGILQIDFGTATTGSDDNIVGIAQQADGKLVVAGPGGNFARVLRLHAADFARRWGSTTLTQNTADMLPGETGDLLHMQVCVEGDTGPAPVVTGFTIDTAGTTLLDDIDATSVYATGTSETYDTTNLFGTVSDLGAAFTVPGSAALTNRISNFWLAYTVDPDAVYDGSHLLDAALIGVTQGGTTYVPAITSPAGVRRIYMTYPEVIGDTSWGDYISRVALNTLDNNSGNTGLGYSDYSTMTTSVTKGQSYDLTVTASSSSPQYGGLDYLSAFVDWNHDYDFTDAGETFIINDTGFNLTTTFTTPIPVPTLAATGPTRLRVVVAWGLVPVPSYGNLYASGGGEAEDYTLQVENPVCVAVGSGTVPWSTAFAACPPGAKYVIPAGLTVVQDVDVNLSADLEVQGALEAVSGAHTFNLTGAGDQTLTGGALAFYHLVVNKAAFEDTVAIAGSLAVTGDLEVQSGRLLSASDYANVSIGGMGTLELTNDITVSGNWANSGLFVANGHKVTFDGAGEQTVSGTDPTTFYDLAVAAGRRVVLQAFPSVTHSVDNHGTLVQSLTVGESASVQFMGFGAGIYQGVDLTTPAGSNLGAVTVAISGNQAECNQPAGSPPYRHRCFLVTATAAGTADLTFYTTAEEDDLDGAEDLYRYQYGVGTWQGLEAVCGLGDGNDCTKLGGSLAVGKNAFLIAGEDAPTALRLGQFRAVAALLFPWALLAAGLLAAVGLLVVTRLRRLSQR